MTTEKVFHNDQYLKTLKATITDIVISKERTEIITDRTIFFAEGGGQPGHFASQICRDTMASTSLVERSTNYIKEPTKVSTWGKII
mgnify:CR=1 FL=1